MIGLPLEALFDEQGLQGLQGNQPLAQLPSVERHAGITGTPFPVILSTPQREAVFLHTLFPAIPAIPVCRSSNEVTA